MMANVYEYKSKPIISFLEEDKQIRLKLDQILSLYAIVFFMLYF